MGFYAVGRRLIRSAANANRMMSTGVSSQSAPWLMLPQAVGGDKALVFYSLAEKKIINPKKKIGDGLPFDMINDDAKYVGSSHGWIALLDRRSNDLFLTNPIAGHMRLPNPKQPVERVILSSPLLSLVNEEEEEEEKNCLVFISGPDCGLAFCSPFRSDNWTFLRGHGHHHHHALALEDENIVYSSRHNRLFCITGNEEEGMGMVLESWDVGDGKGKGVLDWKTGEGESKELERWRERSELKKRCRQLKYLVCDDSSGDLFLVLRHVNLQAGPYGSMLNKVILSRYRGSDYLTTPYKTVEFDVYKIDCDQGEVEHMRDSLQGLAMFVGINHPFAIPASALKLKPDSIYFTDDNCLFESTRLDPTSYGGHDNGIFDYRSKAFSPCCTSYPVDYDQIRKILPPPLWFTPTTTTTTTTMDDGSCHV